MPTMTEASAALEQAIASQWTSTPLAWENAPARDFDAAGQPMLVSGDKDFVQVAIEFWGNYPVVIPTDCVRYFGAITFDIYVKEDTGTRAATGYIDDLANIYDQKTHSNVRMRNLSSVGVFVLAEGWMTTTVQFEFEFDRIVQ